MTKAYLIMVLILIQFNPTNSNCEIKIVQRTEESFLLKELRHFDFVLQKIHFSEEY